MSTPAPSYREPLPKEGKKAFEAFCCYRDLEPETRSLRGVATALGKHLSLIQRWSARNEWSRRVWPYDREREETAENAETQIGEEKERLAKKKEQQDAIRAGVVLSLPAVHFAMRVTEVVQNLHEMPIADLYRLLFRAFNALISLQAAERQLVEDARKLATRQQPKTTRESDRPTPLLFVLFPCPCGHEHEYEVDRWPCESPAAYAAFLCYAHPKSKRSIRGTAAECKRYPSQILRWSRRYQWGLRVALLDEQVEECGSLSAEQLRLQGQFSQIDVSRGNLSKIFEAVLQRREELQTLPFKTVLALARRSAFKSPALQQSERQAHDYWGGHTVDSSGVHPQIQIPSRPPDFHFLKKYFRKRSTEVPPK